MNTSTRNATKKALIETKSDHRIGRKAFGKKVARRASRRAGKALCAS